MNIFPKVGFRSSTRQIWCWISTKQCIVWVQLLKPLSFSLRSIHFHLSKSTRLSTIIHSKPTDTPDFSTLNPIILLMSLKVTSWLSSYFKHFPNSYRPLKSSFPLCDCPISIIEMVKIQLSIWLTAIVTPWWWADAFQKAVNSITTCSTSSKHNNQTFPII